MAMVTHIIIIIIVLIIGGLHITTETDSELYRKCVYKEVG